MITNTNFLTPILLQPDVDKPFIFKLVILGQIVKAWNIKGVHHQAAKLKELEKRICDHCTPPLYV